MKIADIAKVVHETNRALCEAHGDHSQPSWENAPLWQRSASLMQVENHIKNPSGTGKDTHDSWMKQKVDDGWKYGAVKDADKKTHPCIVPYEQLPEHERAKDHVFRAVVSSLAPHLG